MAGHPLRREMELQGIDLDELRTVFPKRVYLLADSLYDAMLAKNLGTPAYHVGGEVYIMEHDPSVGFVKGEMCSPGIATQAEDLIAAGAQDLIHVGFAGGYSGTQIGDVVKARPLHFNTKRALVLIIFSAPAWLDIPRIGGPVAAPAVCDPLCVHFLAEQIGEVLCRTDN